MKQNAKIKVKGTQIIDGESTVTELFCTGTAEQKDNALRLCYEEVSEEGEVSRTTLTLFGQTLKIERTGANVMHMTIQQGNHWHGAYASPMGQLELGTFGTALSAKEGALFCAYALTMNGAPLSDNELEITYTIQ